MTLFDLLFLAALLCTFVTLVVAAVFAIRAHYSRALRTLGIWAICAVAYVAAGLGVSYVRPQTVKPTGEPWCFDDWCLTVERSQHASTATANTYRVDLLLHSRAGRVSQRANGAWIYLIDENGRRFAPDVDSSVVPLDVLLQPQQSIATTRTFHLPPGARAIGLITGHGGSFCGPMSFLIVGDSACVFGKPAMIRID